MPLPNADPPAPTSERLRVATYNLYLGADLTVAFDVAAPDELVERARLVLDQAAATDFPTRARALARILVH